MDIALISAMITGGYEGNLKAAILAVIVFHILLYILARKQVKLKYVFLIIFFMVLIAIKVMRY